MRFINPKTGEICDAQAMIKAICEAEKDCKKCPLYIRSGTRTKCYTWAMRWPDEAAKAAGFEIIRED